ncbi:MAG: hypothetical protein OEW22_02770 [Rubrivivax sp.]|nr:hypothetical protein [Rubrivivax sp.]
MTLPNKICLAALALSTLASAASARDPFEPPAAARRDAGGPAVAPEMPSVHQLVRIDGRRYVVDGHHRYGVGDRFGGARIECIVDGGVVVRDQGALRLLPMFGGIYKRPSAAPAAPPAPLCPKSPGDPR